MSITVKQRMIRSEIDSGHIFVFYLHWKGSPVLLYELYLFPSRGTFRLLSYKAPLKILRPFPVEQWAEIFREIGNACKKYHCTRGET